MFDGSSLVLSLANAGLFFATVAYGLWPAGILKTLFRIDPGSPSAAGEAIGVSLGSNPARLHADKGPPLYPPIGTDVRTPQFGSLCHVQTFDSPIGQREQPVERQLARVHTSHLGVAPATY